MALLVTVGERSARTDHLTLGQVLDIEDALGKKWPQVNPFGSARDALVLVACMFGPEAAVAARSLSADVATWMKEVGDDLPEAFRDCIPSMGGQSFDAYVVAFADPEGFAWPPDVTRRQKVRDLDLLLAAFQGRKRRR